VILARCSTTLGRPRVTSAAVVACLVLVLACAGVEAVSAVDGAHATTRAVPAATVALHRIVGGLDQPLYLTSSGQSGPPRLFVVEKPGRIRIVTRIGSQWQVTGTFLDIHRIVGSAGGEQGLLGLAFAPDYASSGRFYVDYTNTSGNTVIAEYRRASATTARASSARVLLRVQQPFANHNGGWIGFKGANLYIALGDGGSGGDPGNRAQRLDTLLGKILRINPRDPDGAGPRRYGIPADNPFVGGPGLDAIWAYGLRNPWRNSFDPRTGDLWIGDVGQDRFEEIDHAGTARGRNFGWHMVEGRHLYPSGARCASNCRTLPVVEYPHAVAGADNCSVTGGYVARRAGAPLAGQYLFGDFCSGRIWAIPASFNGGSLPSPLVSGLSLSSFGLGPGGRIYAISLSGAIYRVIGT
jgi:glucose/arabinose dehydrogenase